MQSIEQNFISGYCAEYAVALKEYYHSQGIPAEINVIQLKTPDPDFEDEFCFETAHAFVKSIRDEQEVCEDVLGRRDINEIIEEVGFFNTEGQIEVNQVDSNEELESFLGSLEETMIEEAHNLIKKTHTQKSNMRP